MGQQSTYFQYNDPLLITWRKGTTDDPYVDKSDTLKIINQQVYLSEIPSSFDHVTISGYTEVYNNTEILSSNFKVNYSNGNITFNSSEEGKSITATYKGRGQIQYPAERIYFHGENPDIVDNLQEITERGIIAIEAMEQVEDLQEKIDEGNILKTDLETDITTATTKKSDLETSITNANSTKSNLDTSNTTALETKNNLDLSNTTANTTKTNLDSSISTGNSLKSSLDIDISDGNTLHTNLQSDITNGTQLKLDLDSNISDGNELHTTLNTDISNANTMIVNLQNVNTYQIKTATEDLLAGDFVNIYNNSGTVSVRKANATDNTKPAHGFILENVSSGGDIAVYFEGINDKFTGLTVGTKYYLNIIAGQITSTIPSNSNNILQYLGDAINLTSIYFTKRDYIVLL